MNKLLFLIYLSILTSYAQSQYQKMKKSHGFDDDICSYSYSDIVYVKPCEEGKFCKSFGSLSKCQEIETKVQGKTLGDSCSNKYECEKGLDCQNFCTLLSCGINEEAYKTDSGYSCRDPSKRNILYQADTTGITSYSTMISSNFFSYSTPPCIMPPKSPSFYQVEGRINYFDQTDSVDGTIFAVESVESAYIGTLEDETFVMDQKACKSGTALYFYLNKKLVDPSKNGVNDMYLMCVTLNSINIEDNYVKYNGDNIYYYGGLFRTRTLDNNLRQTSGSLSFNRLALIKKELWSKYIGVFTQSKQIECENKKSTEKYTCEDNEVRKWYYFHEHPNEYVLYYDEEEKDNDIMNYLLQTQYETFISGNFLSMKMLISIAMFLFL